MKQSIAPLAGAWIASRSLSSGAHSRDPLARNDGVIPCHAGTGAGSALPFANGRKVNAIRNAPRPNAQEPM